MPLFDEATTVKLKEILRGLKERVQVVFFEREDGCPSCADTRTLLEEIISLTDKVELKVYDFVLEPDAAVKYGVDKAPAIAVLLPDGTDPGVLFYGAPAGYEINSFLTALLEASGSSEPPPPELLERIKKIDGNISIKVFVTLSCPYCPAAVINAHRLAFLNGKIRSEMVESSSFPDYITKYGVTSVPKTVINDSLDFTGAEPLDKLVEMLEKL